MKRFALFFLTNILVVITISIVINLLGIRPYMTASGLDYQALMFFCLAWGMGGALVSLAISRWSAKMMLGVQLIDPANPGAYADLVNMVQQLSKQANLPALPQIGIYQSPEVNAFATGPSKRRSLVAVSTGLLQVMSREEIEGVVGHEIAHIANGDMVTMTLLQGVVNAFVMFFARIIAYFASQAVREDMRGIVHIVVVLALEILFSLLGMLVITWFSRQREFRADRGSAQIAGRDRMIAALRRLEKMYEAGAVDTSAGALASLKASGKSGSLFATHPPLAVRIQKLEAYSG